MKTEREVYEFRYLPKYFTGEVRRYAGGEWIPDDGEYDLAFIGRAKEGFPCCLYVQTQRHENIVCSWLTGHWSVDVYAHPGGNPWHRALKDGAREWGAPLEDYYRHPNTIAGDSGMNVMASENRCSNGRHVEFRADDKHIAFGLLRNAETKEVFAWPENMSCMYCSAIPPVYEKPDATDAR